MSRIGFEELVTDDEIEPGRRFVEQERLGTGHERARDQHAARLSGRHPIDRRAGEMRDTHSLEHSVGGVPHRGCDVAAEDEPVSREEPRQDGIARGDRARAVSVDEPLVEIRADDAETRSEIEDVPAIGAEQPDGRRGIDSARARALDCAQARGFAAGERTVLVGQQVDERRLAGAVRTHDRGVFAGADREADGVEHGGAALHDRRVRQLEDRRTGRQRPPE